MEAATMTPPTSETPPPEDLPGEADDEQAPEEPVVEGSEAQLSLGIGGSRVDEARITLEGGELKMRGQFKKGERFRFLIEGTIDAVEVRDHRDRKTGTVTKTVRKHKATIEGIEKL
jgi:hypothetical protein